jgi:small-conductance mechanosensitive channel
MAVTGSLIQFAQQSVDPEAPATGSTPADEDDLVESHLDWASLKQQAIDGFESFQQNFISWGSLWQACAVVGAILLAYVLSRYPAGRLRKTAEAREHKDIIQRLTHSLSSIVWPAFTVVFLWIATAVFDAIGLPNAGLRVAASLLNAWIVVRFVTSNMKPGFWQTFIAVLAWTIAALYILRLLDPVTGALNAAAFSVGGVITSIFIAIVALWIGRLAGDAAQSQLASTKQLNPSMAGLLGQVLKIGFMAAAILIALSTLGINLTALTVFGGALGVGIGFGLQAIFSNFISGIIILFERSIKVGDFIELQSGVTGLVKEINVRSTLVTTNDNVDILVPNEEFIKAQVINWTLRDARRRMRIEFGVAYGTDKDLVKKAALEAADAVPWTFSGIPGREPQVWLTGFGDSALDFELVVWLTEEAVKKPSRVKADYYWELHTALYKYEIEIPFPQRDINFRNVGEFTMLKDGAKVSDTKPTPAPPEHDTKPSGNAEPSGGSSALNDGDDGDAGD